MAINPSLDHLSYCAIKFASGFAYLPLLPGSQFGEGPALMKEYQASNSFFEPINWVQGLTQPALLVRTRAYNSWFNAANLNAMVNSRNATTGLLANLGEIDFRYGSPGMGGFAGKFTRCKVASLSIEVGPIGTPIDISMLVLPHGAVDVTAFSASINYGMPFLSQGVDYNSGSQNVLDGVEGMGIAFNNGLVPDLCGPIASTANTRIYPQDYYNGPLDFGFSVTQKIGSTTLDTTNTSEVHSIAVRMDSADRVNRVFMALKVLNPERSWQQRMGVGMVQRGYQSIRNAAGTSLTILQSS